MVIQNHWYRVGGFLLFVLAVSCEALFGAEEGEGARLPDLQHVQFHRLGTEEGLPSAVVTCVVEDADGVVWMGTDSGLCRFDGSEVRVLSRDDQDPGSLSSDHLSAMALGPEGEIWVGTSNGGLNRFDPVTERNERFAGSEKLPSDEIVALAVDHVGEHLWVGTAGGLVRIRFSDQRVTRFSGGGSGGRVSVLKPLPDGDLWVGMLDGRLFHWDAERNRLKLRWRSSTAVTALTLDQHRAIWIGTHGAGLYRLSVDQPDAQVMPAFQAGLLPGQVPGKVVTRLHCDREGHLWVATPQGLARLDRATRRSALYRTDPLDSGSLSGNLINHLWEDSRSVLWIATDGGGVSRLELDRFGFAQVRLRRPDTGQLTHSAIWNFFERHDGSVWVGAETGLKRWHPASGWLGDPGWTADAGEGFPGSEGEPFVQSIWEDGLGRVWMGTRGEGLLRANLDGTVSRLSHQPGQPAGLPHDSVTVLHEDVDGHLWIGTMGGGLARCVEVGGEVSFLSAITSHPVPGKGEDPPEDLTDLPECRHVTAVSRDAAGRTWVASWEGLFLLDRSLGRLIHYRELTPRPEALSSEGLLSLVGDAKGFLWAGTVNSGLNRLDPATGEVVRHSRLDHGLPDDRIASLLVDGDGFIWAGTGRGLARLDPETCETRTFGESDGLQRGAFHPGSALRLSSGDLLVGGATGFNIIRPDRLPDEQLPEAPILAGLTLSGEPITPSAEGPLVVPLSRTDEVRLPFDSQSRLSIRLAPSRIINTDRFHYRFRLDGQELHWSIAGSDPQAVYTGLSPGRYRFLAQTSMDGRRWSEETATLSLVILPPWYRTWWSWGLFGIGAGLLVWLSSAWFGRARLQYQCRLREKAEQQRDRAEAELARQLQQGLLLEQAGRESGGSHEVDGIFGSAVRLVAEQFGANLCTILSCRKDEADGEVTFHRLATYPSGNEPDHLPGKAATALRLLIRDHQACRIGTDAASEAGRVLRDFWPGEGDLILHRTSFLDEVNGVIVLRMAAVADDSAKRGSDDAGNHQMLGALSRQIGTAIAQWRIAEKERIHLDVLETARKSAESANQAKSDFLAKMTHELRTPLNAILGFSEVMNEDPELNDRQREVMAIINNSGEHLHEVINGVLDLAKIEAGKIELYPVSFDLERMLRSLHKMLSLRARSKGLAFPLELLTALPRVVETDKSKVRQILINLLGNAIKFTESGSIRLVVWAEAAGEVALAGGVKKRPVRVFFEVSDTGKGIATEEIDTLFDQYTQTKSGKGTADSTGLGLTIAKAFAELMGGRIEVRSEVGEGTTFRLSITCDEVASESEEAVPGAVGIGGGREGSPRGLVPRVRRLAPGHPEVRILIAEDQMPNRLLLRKLLEPAGFTLREAEDGAAAVDRWRDWHPHLILMDEQMPHLTGREATRAILDEAASEDAVEEAGVGGTLPVIVALTAFALDQSRSAAIEAGCSDFLAKPFRSEELFGVIARNLPHLRFEGEGERGSEGLENDAVMLAS